MLKSFYHASWEKHRNCCGAGRVDALFNALRLDGLGVRFTGEDNVTCPTRKQPISFELLAFFFVHISFFIAVGVCGGEGAK